MSLESKSQELKALVATFDTEWFLGDLNFKIKSIGKIGGKEELGQLSSPLRQLYYVAGLNLSTDPALGVDAHFTHEKWTQVVVLLNEIESEYQKLFFPEKPEDVTENWRHVRNVAMPSFLTYFNQGPLNYEEQVLNWIRDLFSPLNELIERASGVSVEELILFYESLDKLNNLNFQAHSTNKELLRPNWKDYSKIKMGIPDDVPDFIRQMGNEHEHLHAFMADHGMVDRFMPQEIVTAGLTIEKVNIILGMLSSKREKSDFLYYTATRPGNPLYSKPIVEIENGMYQVFEVKQVIHAIQDLLESMITANPKGKDRYLAHKGKLLENRIVELFSNFFKADFEVYRGYFVDGVEKDILFLWKDYAFIIEAKGYNLREPLRDPNKAFVRIKDDFEGCIGYGYQQTRSVEKKFIDGLPLQLTDDKGNLTVEIDTTSYKQDFSIIVNLESFGQIQCDLSALLELENSDDVYPWAVKLDDLEIFLLTLEAKKKTPEDFIKFLLMREEMHGKLISDDELEICGSFLTGKLTQKRIGYATSIVTTPDLGDVFDEQYRKTMGFKNEKNLYEKQSGKYHFW